MLDELCNIGQTPSPAIPPRPVPPPDISFLYDKQSTHDIQIEQLLTQASRQDLDVDYPAADEMVTTQRVNRVKAFREIYINGFDLPVDKEILTRFARNRIINTIADVSDPADLAKAIKLLGEHKEVQAFSKEQTLHVTVDSPDDLRDRLREKLLSILPTLADGSESTP